eukprot:TRINITY_DN30098_c0_g1_i2.p1 TRINITY_DN30098_c0_g1~~TRINITY_DN30098_c0_g1_i2.p1  ORF type:complete len:405 (-),score=51.17 TRINITY_DN30098_c0_g1_i2:87-1301(-)
MGNHAPVPESTNQLLYCSNSPFMAGGGPVDVAVNPAIARLAMDKFCRAASSIQRASSHCRGESDQSAYRRLVVSAEANLPCEVSQQISLDVDRTLASLPNDSGYFVWRQAPASKAEALTRVLFAFEWKSAASGVSGGRGAIYDASADTLLESQCPTYVQGYNFLAAMCLGFSGGCEEMGFWLFLHLMEDILGHEYTSRTPPFLGYHADRAVAVELVASEAPLLASVINDRLAEAVSMITARCFLSGFVGFLSDEPLLALWEQLLEGRQNVYPRLPLVVWFVGLIQLAEDGLVALVRRSSAEEICPLIFQHVQKIGRSLPHGWRPTLGDKALFPGANPAAPAVDRRLRHYRGLAENAWRAYLCCYVDGQRREGHVRCVNDTLCRTAAKLADLREIEQRLQGLGGA